MRINTAIEILRFVFIFVAGVCIVLAVMKLQRIDALQDDVRHLTHRVIMLEGGAR